MNPYEVSTLLSVAYTLDGRITHSESAVEVWLAVLDDDMGGEWALEWVRRWYGRHDEMMTPAMLNKAWGEHRRVASEAKAIAAESGPKCPFPDCNCTHTEPCVAGWLDNDREVAVPCPRCRPGLSDMLGQMPPLRQRQPSDTAILRSSERTTRFSNGIDR